MLAGQIDVHCELELVPELVLPLTQVAAGALGNQLGHGDNQPGFFGDRNKGTRINKTQLGVIPAYQRLKTHQGCGLQIHDGLVMVFKFIPLDRLAQIRFSFQQMQRFFMQGFIENFILGFAVFFGMIHCCVGVPDDVLGFIIISGI